jgi:hypothetical protein
MSGVGTRCLGHVRAKGCLEQLVIGYSKAANRAKPHAHPLICAARW